MKIINACGLQRKGLFDCYHGNEHCTLRNGNELDGGCRGYHTRGSEALGVQIQVPGYFKECTNCQAQVRSPKSQSQDQKDLG